MTSLVRLYAGKVEADEIDDLGHMNVRYYGERALGATAALLDRHGLGRDASEAASLDVFDIFTRHYREQMVDAPLEVHGGVLAVDERHVRLYHELTNTETGDVAATFVHRVRLRRPAGEGPLSPTDRPEPVRWTTWPAPIRKSLAEALVDWPAHGRPRSVDLDHAPPALSLTEARARGLELRRERLIRQDECDASGFVPPMRRQELVWGGQPMDSKRAGPPIYDLPDGSRMSLAALETRAVATESPRAGMRIQSFSAIVGIASKTLERRTWLFDVERERLLHSNTLVDIALHLGERRALVIPDELRASFEAELQPDLR